LSDTVVVAIVSRQRFVAREMAALHPRIAEAP